MAVLRTEEWTKDIDGMLSTVVVDIHDRERVRVASELQGEFGLTRGQQLDWTREWAEFPYTIVAGRLRALGWRRSDDGS